MRFILQYIFKYNIIESKILLILHGFKPKLISCSVLLLDSNSEKFASILKRLNKLYTNSIIPLL